MKKISEKGFVSFGQAIKDFFVGYIEFGGVSTRAGYWWAQLGMGIVYFILFIWTLSSALSQVYMIAAVFPIFLIVIFTLGMVIPSFALSIRRLRDTGIKSKAILYIYVVYFALASTTFAITYLKVIGQLTSVMNSYDTYYQVSPGNMTIPAFLMFCTCLVNVFLTAITLLPTDFFATDSQNGFLKAIFKEIK